jgi:hypothetical protein
MNKYAPVPDETKQAIVATLKAYPHRNYEMIAIEHGVSKTLVGRLAKLHDCRRKTTALDRVPQRSRVQYAHPDHPHMRDGGILANDEQWKARQCRIGGRR